MLVQEEIAKAKAAGQTVTPRGGARAAAGSTGSRPTGRTTRPIDYWLEKWGPFNLARLTPDSSAEAAAANPRLYVDSLLFYEESAIRFAADGAKAVRAELGEDVLCGANYSAHPFYYPHSTMYIKWFRGGAADLGRHSEYFWQVAQAGPMVNGYVAEHFRCRHARQPAGRAAPVHHAALAGQHRRQLPALGVHAPGPRARRCSTSSASA